MEDIILKYKDDLRSSLTLFGTTTNVVVSLLDRKLCRVFGPVFSSPFARLLFEASSPSGQKYLYDIEKSLARETFKTKKVQTITIKRYIEVHSIPVLLEDAVIGAIVTGWTLNDVPDPSFCDDIAQTFELPMMEVISAVRMEQPLSREQFSMVENLLRMFFETLVKQYNSIEELERSSVLKDRFLAMVSHELRTPLTTILLGSQMMKKSQKLDQEIHKHLRMIERSALTEAHLIDELLESATLLDSKVYLIQGEFVLGDLISSAMSGFEELIEEKNISIIKNIQAAKDIVIYGDFTKICKSIRKILENAIQMSPMGGRIFVDLLPLGEEVVIQIRDEGKGFEQAFASAIFDQFSLSPSLYGRVNSSLGLGLNYAHRIIQAHGGSIAASSPGVDLGTTFTVKLRVHFLQTMES